MAFSKTGKREGKRDGDCSTRGKPVCYVPPADIERDTTHKYLTVNSV